MNSNHRYEAVRRLQFCAGHRVHMHESKCNNMHGHNYVIYFHARAKDIGTMIHNKEELDNLGRVIDFSVIKAKMNDWIQTYWDHGFIYYTEDQEVFHALNQIAGQKTYSMPANPTAENMAFYLLERICPMLFRDTNVEIYKIVLYETENCSVEVTI